MRKAGRVRRGCAEGRRSEREGEDRGERRKEEKRERERELSAFASIILSAWITTPRRRSTALINYKSQLPLTTNRDIPISTPAIADRDVSLSR